MIPDEAVEAAARVIHAQHEASSFDDWSVDFQDVARMNARAALEAAAPHIVAAALKDAADDFHARLPDGTGNGRAYNSHQVAYLLRARAASMEDQCEGITHGDD